MVVEQEFKTWADVDAALTMQAELVEKAWPDLAKRTAFFNKWNSYWGMHTDNIYTNLTHLKK